MQKSFRIAAALLLASLATTTTADQDESDKPGKSREAKAAKEISPEQRAAAQADAMRDYLARDMIFIAAPGIEAYLISIAEALLATQESAPPTPKFLVQSTDEFTVFTDNQGNIVVGSGVLRQVESEDELAAALSHELAHVMARDADTKNLFKKVPYTVETAGLIAGAVDARLSKTSLKPGQLTDFASDSLKATQSVGTFWSDLVAPTWNRQQEREADLVGVDMVRAANYDPAAFGSLFNRIDAAHTVRSERVERVRQEALKKIQARAPAAGPQSGASTSDQARDALKQMRLDAQAVAIQSLFDGLAGWGTEYDSPEERTTAVLAYVQETTAGRKDKTRRSPRFAAELREGDGGRLLAADGAALELLRAASAGGPVPPDADIAQRLGVMANGDPLSPHLNYALGTWLDAKRRPADAEQRAVTWMNSPLAPRTAYMWRASYQVGRREFAAALETLDRGAATLGNRSLFLPDMVIMAKAGGDIPKAEKLATECGRSSVKLSLATLSRALQKETPAKASGTYGECVAALGYDPIEKSRQAQSGSGDDSRLAQKTSEFNKKLAETFRKLGQ